MSTGNQELGALDEIIEEIGQYGKYNILNYFLILLPTFLVGIYTSAYIFTAGDIEYRCQIQECEALNNTDWITWAIPSGAEGFEKCLRYSSPLTNGSREFDVDICSAEWFDEKISKCDQFVYGSEKTIVSDFNLGCEEWKRTLVGTIRNSGFFLSIPLTGLISDHIGRKFCLIMATTIYGVTGLLRSFLNSYKVYVVFEFLEAALGGGMFTTAFVLIIETASPKNRIVVNTLLSVVFSTGLMVLAGLQWVLQDWRLVLRVAFTPALFFIFYFWILDESVRWLLAKGRFDEAIQIIQKAAKINNVDISDKLLSKLQKTTQKSDDKDQELVGDESSSHNIDRPRSKLRDIFKSSVIMKRLMFCTFLWLTGVFSFYGLAINSVSLYGNKYLNYMLVCAVEVPSQVACIFVINRFGRRSTMIITFSIGGLCCFITALIPKGMVAGYLLVYLLGKFSLSVAFSCVYVYTSEVFPTSLRQSLFAICSMVGRVGSLLAPQLPLMSNYMASLPNILFGSMAVLSGVISFILPETTNIKLPDTIEEAENIGKKPIN